VVNSFLIAPGAGGDLPGIVDVLNFTIMNSNATLVAQPVSVAGLRTWLERFSASGPYRLLVARRGDEVLGYAASQRMLRAMEQLQQQPEREQLEAAIEIIDVLRELPFEVDLWETQNRWYHISQDRSSAVTVDPGWSRMFRGLGNRLEIAVDQLTVDN